MSSPTRRTASRSSTPGTFCCIRSPNDGTAPGKSTYRHQADALSFIIPGNALSARVKGQDPIHQEGVPVMTMFQFHGDQPATVGHLFHRIGRRVPPVEVADEAHGFGLRRLANKVNRPQGLLITVGSHNGSPVWSNIWLGAVGPYCPGRRFWKMVKAVQIGRA